MRIKRLFFFLLLLAVILPFTELKATHIVGGELYYKMLAPDQYEFTLIIYRDCLNGIPLFDNPAYLSVFDTSGNRIMDMAIDWTHLVIDTVPVEISDSCTDLNSSVCYERGIYTFVQNLPFVAGGFNLAYDRCCWNSTVTNLINPLNQGLTIVSSIPGDSLPMDNNSPYFINLTPPFICLNQKLEFDHSAIDIDGDSLAYELFTPFNSTKGFGSSGPPLPPPYQPLIKTLPDFNHSIDPITGLLTAFPNEKGQFVFGVRVKEYRNGVEIGQTSRSYQVNVEPCARVTEASFPNPIVQCGDSLVRFGNTSFGAINYLWDFGDPTSSDPGSTNMFPSHLYSGIDAFKVQLIAYSHFGDVCNDTTYGDVKLYPEFKSNFIYADEKCDNYVQFTDITSTASGNLTRWHWNFGDGYISEKQNPYHFYNLKDEPTTYQVKLKVENENKCIDSVILPYTGVDRVYAIDGIHVSKSIIYPRNDSTFLSVDAQNAVSFDWTPIEGLTDPTSANTFASPNRSRRYKVVVTDDRGCTDEGKADVAVFEYTCGESETYVPNAFSPNGDGENDYLRVRGEEISKIDLSIYNRWGEEVFTSNNISMLSVETLGWDGTYKGTKQDPGIYVYYLKVRCSDDRDFIKKGNITLLR